MPTRVAGVGNKEDRGDDDPRDEDDDRDTILYFAVHFFSFSRQKKKKERKGARLFSKEARSLASREKREKKKHFESRIAVFAAESGSLNLIFRVEGRGRERIFA